MVMVVGLVWIAGSGGSRRRRCEYCRWHKCGTIESVLKVRIVRDMLGRFNCPSDTEFELQFGTSSGSTTMDGPFVMSQIKFRPKHHKP